MSSARVAVNTVKTENIVGSSRMDEDPDVLKQNGGGQDGGKTTSPTPEVRSDSESRPEVVKTATTTSGDSEVKDGTNGRSQYHSIQRLLSPSAGTGSSQQPAALNGAVSGSQQSTVVGGAAGAGGVGGGRYPMTSSSSAAAAAAASLMSGLIAGLFVDKDPVVETSASVRHGTQQVFRKDAIHEDPQKAEVMASSKVEGQRSADGVTRKVWAVEDGSDGARNGGGGRGGEGLPGMGGGREVEVSSNDFLMMDSTEDNEFAMKSPLTDLSNTSSSEEEDEEEDEEEEDLSDGREEEELLLNGNRHQRFQAAEEEEEEEDMELDVQGKTCGRGGEDAEVNGSYLEDGASGFSDSGSYGDSVEAKRARMESIVTNMKRSPSSTSNEIAHAERGLRIVDPRRPKRKQYIPKQHDSSSSCRRSAEVVEAEPEMAAAAAKKIRTSEKEELQQELCRMQDRLEDMREKYFQIFGGDPTLDKRYEEGDDDDEDEEAEQGTSETEREKRGATTRMVNNNRLFVNGSSRYLEEQTSPLCADAPNELKHLAGLLKAEISNTVGTLVDEIVKNFLKRNHRGQTKGPITSSKWNGGPDSTANSTEKVSSIDDKIREDQISGDQKEEKEEVSTPQSDTKPLLLLPPYFSQNPVHTSPPSSTSLLLPQPVRPQPASILTDFSKVSVGGFSHLLPFSTAAPSKPLKSSSSKLAEKFLSPFFDSHHHHHIQRSPMPAIFPHPFFHHPPVMAAAAAAAVAAGMFAKEPEQTEALPLIVNTPTKKKRTKVTDTRLSPRAARAILQENGQTHQRHHQQQQQPYPAHMAEDGTPTGSKQQNHPPSSSTQASTDHHRPNSNETEQDSFFTSFHPHHQHQHHNHHQAHPHHHHQQHHVSHHHHSLLPVTLPTSVAIPNPSLRHSDIMQAFYGHRKHHQHQHQHQQQCLELDLPATSSSSPRSASQQQQLQQRFSGSGLDRPRASLPPSHVMRSASSSPEVGQTSSDGFSGSMMTKADSMDNYDGSIYDDQAMTSTLTPMHLRKAKLMFFYVRYPSSAILKVYFPDVKFNKNNTAQLIKWFSNFREFYYIQMEKYARQALAEGVKNPGDIVVSSDSELYRVLVLHYNRNNRIEVPDNFRQTVQATLREFFKSIQGEKDQEPSWKKSIYKVIAHLDDTVPEYFKSPNWMEQLADG